MENFFEKNLIPIFSRCINSSESELALESLKAAKALVYYSHLADLTQVLNNALQHKSKDVAYLSLDVLRLIHETESKVKPLTPGEYKKILVDSVIPFLVTCFRSSSDDIVINAMNAANILSDDAEIKGILFNPLEKMMLHKNKQIAYLALDIIRKAELKNDVLISMYPFFCDQALSTPGVAIDSLKILDTLIDYGIVGDYKNLQKALWHKNDTAAHLALDVLRKIKGPTKETGMETVRPISIEMGGEKGEKMRKKEVYQHIKEKPIEEPMQRQEELQTRIIDVLKTNPRYVDRLKEIKSKYKI